MATPRRPRQNRHYRIDHELKPDDLAAYHAFLREPRTTNKSAHAWLAGRGYTTFSPSAVARHMRHFLRGVHERRAAEQFAERCVDLARSGGGGGAGGEQGGRDGNVFLRGAVVGAEHLMFEAMWDLRHTVGPATPQSMKELVDTMRRLIDMRRQLGQLVDALDTGGARASSHELSQWLRDLLARN